MAQSRESCAAALVPQSSKISLLIVPTATETLTSSTRRNTSCPVTASPPRPRLTSHFSVLLRFPLHFTSLRYIAIPLQIIIRARLIHSLARFFVSQLYTITRKVVIIQRDPRLRKGTVENEKSHEHWDSNHRPLMR